jgi:hypothetical protein
MYVKVENFTIESKSKRSFEKGDMHVGNNFKIEYDQLVEAYNGGQCAMLLIKNVTTTSKGDQYLRP